MGLAVQIVLNEEVASLFEVDAAVIADKALGVVKLVPGLHNGATGWRDEGRLTKAFINLVDQNKITCKLF